MAYTKTQADADAYFKENNHTKAETWKSFSEGQRVAAFAQAKRELQLFMNRDLSDPLTTDKIRDDYAHFEQTIYLLENATWDRTKGMSAAQPAKRGKMQEREITRGLDIGPMVKIFLGLNRMKRVRG